MSDMTSVTRHTGLALRLERVARDVKARDLASAMGVTSGWVSRIESRRVVPTDTAEKYLAALATFPTVTNASDAPSAA